jgi:hypothetical protein
MMCCGLCCPQIDEEKVKNPRMRAKKLGALRCVIQPLTALPLRDQDPLSMCHRPSTHVLFYQGSVPMSPVYKLSFY